MLARRAGLSRSTGPDTVIPPDFNAVYAGLAGALTITRGSGWHLHGSAAFKLGVVFGAQDPSKYTGGHVSLIFSLMKLPKILRERIARVDTGRLYDRALSAVSNGLPFIQAILSSPWGPFVSEVPKLMLKLYAGGARELSKLTDRLPGESMLELFAHAGHGYIPWGVAFMHEFSGNAASIKGPWTGNHGFSITATYVNYWKLGTF